jgi:hypothetical protein
MSEALSCTVQYRLYCTPESDEHEYYSLSSTLSTNGMAVAPFIDCLTSDGHQHFQPRERHSSVLYSAVQYSTVQYCTIQYRIKKTQGLYTKPVKGNRDMYADVFLLS